MAQDDFQAFIERIKQAESRGQRYDSKGNLLTSPKGAQGEMQVMPATQRAPGFGVAPVRDNSPDEIARVGRDVLHAFNAKYGGNRMYIAAAYNWGPGNVDKWIAGGADFNKLPRETQRYLQQVAPEALAQGRGQRPSATATAAAPSEPAPADTRTIAIGDSLAVGFAQANKLGGLHKGGAAPKAVLKMVQDYAANNNLEGVTVYLGTGLPNNPAQREFVTRQVELIKSKGGIPVLFGAGPGSERTPTTGQNEFLQSVAQSTGAQFTGPLADRFPGIEKRDRTGLHLTHPQYRQLFAQMRGSAPPAAAAATTAVQPAGAAATAPTTAAAAAAAPVAAATAARAEDLGSGYKAALALAFLGEEEKERESTDDELRDRLNRQEDEAAARELAEYRPVNPLQNLEITALNPIRALQPPVRMAEGGEIAEQPSPKQTLQEIQNTAQQGQAYRDMQEYLKSRDAMPSVRFGYLPPGTHGLFSSDRLNIGTGSIKLNEELPSFPYRVPRAPAVLAHEVAHAADRQMMQQAIEQRGKGNKFTEAYEKMVGPRGENRTALARQFYPEWTKGNRSYRATPHEIAAHGVGAFAGPNLQDSAPLHVDPTAATEFEILLDLARRHVNEGPKGAARIPAFFKKMIGYSDGGEVNNSELMLSKGNEQIGNTAPPRYSAREMEAYLRTANPGASVLEYARGPGDAMGFVNSRMPDVINVKRTLTPGTREQTILHELEHSMDMRGGDIFGRPEIAQMDNNFRAYHLLNNDWRPVEKFVGSVIQNKDKLSKFFGQDIVSGYITMDPETLKKLQARGKDRALFSEQIASLSALEQATGKSLTRDPEMRKIFPNTQMMAVYDALTGLRQTRTDARDLPPHTPLPSYMYETNPVTRFIREKTTGKNEYGIPIKRSNGGEAEPTPEEIAAASRPATFNPNIARQGAAARALAARRDVNLLPDPRTYAAVSGFLGQAPDQLGFSAMHPDIQGITRAGEVGFAASMVPVVAPVFAPVARAVGKGATALGMRAEKALEAPVTRTLERGGRSAEMLQALGTQPSFAVRPKGGHFELRPDRSGMGMAVWDDVKQTVSDTLANTADQPLNNWFSTKYATYLRRDLGTEGDPFVKAADAGKKLHIPNRPLDEDWQATLRFRRKEEGLPPQGFATTPYGKNVEDALDTGLNIRELGDLASNTYTRYRIPPGVMQFAETNPQMRVYSLDEILDTGPRSESLRNTMLEMRQPAVSFYGESVTIPKNYQLTNETLQGLTPVQASERAAAFDQWKETARQRAASSSIYKNPDVDKTDAGGGFLWVNAPDLAEDPKMRRLIQDVGCDGNWCTREEVHSLNYGSGNSRLSILLNDKARPVAQMTIDSFPPTPEKFLKSLTPEQLAEFRASNPLYKYAQGIEELAALAETSPQYRAYLSQNPGQKSITEIKGVNNKEDLTGLRDLKKIQDRVKALDAQYGLLYVLNLDGINMTDLTSHIKDTLTGLNVTLSREISSATRKEAFRLNGGSRYINNDPQEINKVIAQAYRNITQPPLSRASGGMVERREDTRAYL